MTVMVITASSLVCSVMIVRFHYRNTPIPKWIRLLVFVYLRRLVRVDASDKIGPRAFIDKEEDMKNSWRLIGRILDRTFAFFYLTILFLVTLGLLVIRPSLK